MLRERVEILSQLFEIEENIEGYYLDEAIAEMFNVSSEYGIEEVMDEYWDDEMINEYIKNEEDWTRIACFLAGADNLNDAYHRVDGYVNLQDINKVDVQCSFEDLRDELKEEIYNAIVQEFDATEMIQKEIDELVEELEEELGEVKTGYATDDYGATIITIKLDDGSALVITVLED